MPRLDGSTHINLTVTDLERSTEWYARVFGFVVVNDVAPPDYDFRFRTLVHPQSFASVVLGQPAGAGPDVFDEHRVGLHHLGYHVPERADLDEWAAHLDGIGVEHSGITVSNHEAGAQVWLRDPDNIWIEFYWVNRSFFADRLRQRWREARRAGRSDWTSFLAAPPVER
ncbi:VOC family protein [Nonomuraea muscovyensis]|uniref:Catechol 2,3-dioxygenase-like lactoylglutathione lyase family enzyme n=1 Tax=Nonomuraea muscovyensis TaxID=1124761 RepID=A0A7X0C3D4_9ACTN|nr:VOC family protein [Nonomuraea muscovyensis]MBB6347800.1 catechol 2,3-dioxygenase-like lactoylglutathione lyase family enzyme [Nonomuraea muscovyensis]MDF2704668.1 Glyoxalase/bleomycin resistance protein/dioxygenase [Nonomuraea muscovyensis]